MRINCLSCGHKVELDEAYDDFEGQVKCVTCGALLEILTDEGKLKKIKLETAQARSGGRSRRAEGLTAS